MPKISARPILVPADIPINLKNKLVSSSQNQNTSANIAEIIPTPDLIILRRCAEFWDAAPNKRHQCAVGFEQLLRRHHAVF